MALIACPECGTKMRPKIPDKTEPGTNIQITCRCGQKIRFAAPRDARKEQSQKFVDELMRMAQTYNGHYPL